MGNVSVTIHAEPEEMPEVWAAELGGDQIAVHIGESAICGHALDVVQLLTEATAKASVLHVKLDEEMADYLRAEAIREDLEEAAWLAEDERGVQR